MRLAPILLAAACLSSSLEAQGTAADSLHAKQAKDTLGSIYRRTTSPTIRRQTTWLGKREDSLVARRRLVDTVRLVRVDTVYVQAPPPAPTPAVASVAIHATASSVAAGAQLQLIAEPKAADGTTLATAVRWSIDSAQLAIADISGTGILTGKAGGVVTVYARADSVTGARDFTITSVAPPPPDTTPAPPPPPPPPPTTAGFPVPSGLGLTVAAIAELPRDTVPTPYPATTSTLRVASGADLQAALNASSAGSTTVLLAPGAVFTGEYLLPKHAGAGAASCSSWNIVRTDVPDSLLGAPGTRMTPTRAAQLQLAKLEAPGNQQAIGDAWGVASVGCWRLVGLEVLPGPTGFDVNGLVRFGDHNLADSTKQSHHLVLDRSYVHGVPVPAGVTPPIQGWQGSIRRCVIFNSRFNVVVDSWLERCRGGNGDAQAILAYAGTGPYRVSNSTLSGGTEVVMFGGATSAIVGAVPSDITLHGNLFTRELADTLTLVKNLLEFKNAERVDAAGNVYRFNWIQAQQGYALLLKSVNQSSGSCTWCRSRHITVRYSRITQSANGINLAGIQEAPAMSAGPYTIYHVALDSIGFRNATDARPLQILGGYPTSLFDVTLAYTTIAPASWGLISWDGAAARVAMQSNAWWCGAYGIKGSGVGAGTATLTADAIPYAWSAQQLYGCSGGYPAGTTYTSSLQSALSSGAGAQLGTILDRVEVPR